MTQTTDRDNKPKLSPAMKEVILCLRRGGQLWLDRATNRWLYSGYRKIPDQDANDLLHFDIIAIATRGRISDFYSLTELGKTIEL
jgi:hypothetical protein